MKTPSFQLTYLASCILHVLQNPSEYPPLTLNTTQDDE
jgi:hypothetical protein